MVVYRGYAGMDNDAVNEDKSFMFMIGRRRVTSVAPQIDYSGMPELLLSLYKPSGELYATKKALPGDFMVSIGIPAADNTEPGEWKYVVEEVHGFEGERVVLTTVIDGIYDMHDPYWPDEWPEEEWPEEEDGPASYDIIIRSNAARSASGAKTFPATFAPPKRPRGVIGGVYHHQLGDGARKVTEQIDGISFGGLVNPDFVEVWRVDSDLVFTIKGVPDRVTLPGWFTSQRPLTLSFGHDGSSWSAADVVGKAVTREPKISVHVVSNDEYIVGGDGDDRLSGRDDLNTHFTPGRGNDTVTFGGKGSTMYYRKGDGHDVITGDGDEGSHRVIHFHTDVEPKDVSASREGSDMVIYVPDGSIIVKGWFEKPLNKIELVSFFSDGTVWDVRSLEQLAAGVPVTKREVEMTFDERFVPQFPGEPQESGEDGRDWMDESGGGCSSGSALPIMGILISALCVARHKTRRGGRR
jgi:hypothetical protein